MELWHEIKVHAVYACDQGRGHKDDGNNGKDFDDAVLIDVDEAEEGILEGFQPLEGEVGVVDEGADVFEEDADGFAVVFGEVLAADEEGEDALDVKESLSESDDEFLEGLDAQDDILLDIGVGEVFDVCGELVDELREEFYMVGVGIYDLFDKGEEEMLGGSGRGGGGFEAAHEVPQNPGIMLAKGDEFIGEPEDAQVLLLDSGAVLVADA